MLRLLMSTKVCCCDVMLAASSTTLPASSASCYGMLTLATAATNVHRGSSILLPLIMCNGCSRRHEARSTRQQAASSTAVESKCQHCPERGSHECKLPAHLQTHKARAGKGAEQGYCCHNCCSLLWRLTAGAANRKTKSKWEKTNHSMPGRNSLITATRKRETEREREFPPVFKL